MSINHSILTLITFIPTLGALLLVVMPRGERQDKALKWFALVISIIADQAHTTRVWLNDINTQFNPFISLVNRLQFDTVSRQLGWQSRFRWITRPGNDIFFVYTHNWTDRTTLQTLDRKGSIKIVRTIRF